MKALGCNDSSVSLKSTVNCRSGIWHSGAVGRYDSTVPQNPRPSIIRRNAKTWGRRVGRSCVGFSDYGSGFRIWGVRGFRALGALGDGSVHIENG